MDQLVESYIADIVLFMMEVLGPKRAEHFKSAHLQMRTPTPKSSQRYRSIDPYGTNAGPYDNEPMQGTSRNFNHVTPIQNSSSLTNIKRVYSGTEVNQTNIHMHKRNATSQLNLLGKND